ncbi:MAG: M36 family metallopeptidase [Planctomycetales bacterium]|nr:M36 family metallopeptidase [Planctomycetales bacterium]
MGAISMDGNGNIALGYNVSSTSVSPGIRYTGRLASDPLGTMPQGEHELIAGQGNNSLNRWGDYSAMSIDPADDATFWFTGEYADNGVWATRIGSFQLQPANDNDWYRVNVHAGDVLDVAAVFPGQGSGEFVNGLVDGVAPALRLELYDPSGALAAGPAETIQHTATEEGDYRVRVFADGGAGEYFVTVGGATGAGAVPRVVGMGPNDGATVAAFPTTIRLDFSEAIYALSVEAGDLLVGGLPALSVVQLDGDTFEFTIDPAANVGDGAYLVTLADNQLVDLQNQGNIAYSGTFLLDTTGPRVTSTLWNGQPFPADRVFAPGPLTIDVSLNEELRVFFRSGRGIRTPSRDDIVLENLTTGSQSTASSINANLTSDQFEIVLPNLSEGNYRLRLLSGDDAFEDIVGNDLDGEPLGPGVDGAPSGDGSPGGDYVIDFYVDRDQTLIDHFVGIKPLGGLMYEGSPQRGLINFAGDVDRYEFPVEAGQTYTVTLVPNDAAAILEVDGIAAVGPGESIVVPVTPAPGAQTVSLPIKETTGASTTFDFRLYLNTLLEATVGDTDAGQELAIDDSLLDVGGGRWGALGTTFASSGGLQLELHNDPNEFVDISTTGTPLNLSDDGEADITTSVGNVLFPAGTITVANNGVVVGEPGVSVSTSNDSLPTFDFDVPALIPFWDDIDSDRGNVFWQELLVGGINALIVQWHDRPHFPGSSSSDTVTFQVQLFESGPVLARYAYQDVQFGDAGLDFGASATVGYQESTSSALQFSFNQAALADGDVIDFAMPSTSTDVERYTLDLTGRVGHPIDILLDGQGVTSYAGEVLELLDVDGATVLATASAEPLLSGVRSSNFDLGILDFVVPADGVYTLQLTAGISGEYGLVVTDSLTFDTEPNETPGDPLRGLDDTGTALGMLGGPLVLLTDESAASAALSHEEESRVAAYFPLREARSLAGGDLANAAAGDSPAEIARNYLAAEAGDFGELAIVDQYTSEHTGVTHVYLRQMLDGLPIVNADANVNVLANGRILSAAWSFVPLSATASLRAAPAPQLTADEALAELAGYFDWSYEASLPGIQATSTSRNSALVLPPSGVSHAEIPALLHYVPTADGRVALAWNLQVQTVDGDHWYDASVDAATGKVLQVVDWAHDFAQYNVLHFNLGSPHDGGRTLITDPADLVASPFGWHDVDGIAGDDFTDTRGNNVQAQEDADDNDTGGNRPDGGAAGNLVFDFVWDESMDAEASEDASITNLFYLNNVLHDIHYQYGFTEVAGNFQENNYGNGGIEGDALRADALDGSGTNNANFFTPPDGIPPRMQQFIFDLTSPTRDSALENDIVVHEYGHGVSNRLTGGPSNASALFALQSGGMGEGWSDWWGLMFSQTAADAQTDAYPIGNYVLGLATNDTGVRRFPYSFNMAIDPLTYDDFNGGFPNNEVHNSGEIWASALWDLNWLLINGDGSDIPALGFDPDFYAGSGGNNLALQLVMDGLKLQPANPSFLDARDAILAADVALTGGANSLAIWTAFARRGMGFSASDGGSGDSDTVVAAFDLPATSDGMIEFDRDSYEVGDTILVTLRDSDLTGGGPIALQIESTGGDVETITLAELGSGVFAASIATSGVATPGDDILGIAPGNRITVLYNDADDGTGNPAVATAEATVVLLIDVLDADFSTDTGDPFDEGFTISGPASEWHLSTGRGADSGHSADDSFYFGSGEGPSGGGQHDNDSEGSILSPLIDLTGFLDARLEFAHFLESESGFDFASVHVIHPAGSTQIAISGAELPTSTAGFETVDFDLSAFVDQTIQVEFRFTSDGSVVNEGWYVDDVRVRGGVSDPALVGPRVAQISPSGAVQIYDIDTIDVTFNEPIDSASALEAANYELLEAGDDATFGTADDQVIGVAPTFDGAAMVALHVDPAFVPLRPGMYQLTLDGDSSIEDLDGNPLNSTTGPGGGSDHVHRFDIVVDIEIGGDFYTIDLTAGQVLVVRTGAVPQAVPNELDPKLVLFSPSGIPIASDDDSLDGLQAEITYVAAETGTYSIQIVAAEGPYASTANGEYLLTTEVRAPSGFHVVGQTLVTSGVELELSDDVDLALLNLYDGADATADLPDATLLGATQGPIAGSLVWNPNSQAISFVATGGPLPPDDYTLTLFAHAEGFVSIGGERLDGNGDGLPGDDFVYQFTLAATTDRTASLPDFARGRGQVVELLGTNGIPVRLDDGEDITEVTFAVAFDPELLSIHDFELPGELPNDWSILDSNLATPGIAELTLGGSALPAGPVDLAYLLADVPTTASPGAAHLLAFAEFTVTGTSDAIRRDVGVHAVANVGDATGDQAYSGLDAAWLANVAVGAHSGFDAFAMLDPHLIGDVTGNGKVTALDAAFVGRKAVGLSQPEIPDLANTGGMFAPGFAENPTTDSLASQRSAALQNALASWDFLPPPLAAQVDDLAQTARSAPENQAASKLAPIDYLLATTTSDSAGSFTSDSPSAPLSDADSSQREEALDDDSLLDLLAADRPRIRA